MMTEKLRKLTSFISILFLFMTSVPFLCLAQEMPNLLPNTPEASALIQNVDYPVSYSTGLPNITIPFHSITVQNIKLPISMSYRPGGFKASEQEGVAGVGWSLSTDLQISRVVYGLDDFRYLYGSQYGYYYQNDGRQFHTYYQVTNKSFLQSYKEALYEKYRGDIDTQPDCFYYSLLSGKSGKFYFQKDEWNPLTIIQVPYTGVKIEILSETRGTGTRGDFKITDTDGTEYIYDGDDTEINTGHLGEDYCSNDYANNISGYISTWKCSQIISANKKDVITFSYVDKNIDSYTISGKDYVQMHYDRDVDPSVDQPTSVEIFDAIVYTDPSSNVGLTSSMFNNYTNETAICIENYSNKTDFFNYCEAWGYSIYNSPVVYTKHSTGEGSAVVVPVSEMSYESDDLVLENNDLMAATIVRQQERLRLETIDFPNGSYNYYYTSPGGQLSEIRISNSGSLSKQIYFHQTESGTTNGTVSSSQYGSYADGTTYYLDSIVVTTSDVELPYKFYYNNRKGFENYLKPHTTFGEYNSSNSTVLDNILNENMFLNSVSDGNGNALSFIMGNYFEGVDDYLSTAIYTQGLNLIDGTNDIGALIRMDYPTGLSDYFIWEQNKVYAYPSNAYVGGLRIKEISHKDGTTLLLNRSFKYGKDENGCGILKQFNTNDDEYYETGYNALISSLDCDDVNNGSTQPSWDSYMLKNYHEDATYYTLKEIYNTNYTGTTGTGLSTRFDNDVQLSFEEVSAAYNSTSDPRFEFYFEELMTSKESTFYPNNSGNLPFSYSSPVYYNVVAEYRGDDLSLSGKTIYTYNTEAPLDLHFGNLKNCDGIYSPHCEWAYGHLVSKVDYEVTTNGSITYTPVHSVVNEYNFETIEYVDLAMRHFNNKTNARKNQALFYYLVSSSIPNVFEPETGGIDVSGYAVMDNSIVTSYFGNESVVATSYYEYDEDILLPSKVTTQNSDGTTYRTENEYSNNYCTILENQHRLNSLINKRTYANNALKETEKYIYDTWLTDNSLVALEKIQTSTHSNSLTDRIVYHNYDSNGNPAEVSKSDDVHQTYVWGYNNQFPLAQFLNRTKTQVDGDATLSNYLGQLEGYKQVTTTTQRNGIKTLNSQIRSRLPDKSLVTTFTFDPMVGVTSKCGPDGTTTFFEYDTLGRLSVVRDDDGNLLNNHDYHYVNQH